MSDLIDRLVDEAEANLFAIMLLIPEEMIRNDELLQGRKCIDYEHDEIISELAEKYGVSDQLMMKRLVQLEIINL